MNEQPDTLREAVDRMAPVTRALMKLEADAIHAMAHSFEGDNEDCPTCIEVRERQARWEAENLQCTCDCCDHGE